MKTALIAFALTFVSSTAFAHPTDSRSPSSTMAAAAVPHGAGRQSHDTHQPRLTHASAKTTTSHASRASVARSSSGRR